jgi:hypothetical protein
MPECQFLFSAILVFYKSYTGNILGIGRKESQTSYYSRREDGVQSRDGGGLGAGHIIGWCGSPLAAPPGGVAPLAIL